MRRKSTDGRQVRSQAGDPDWYATPQGRRETRREFARALRDGTLIRSTGSRIPKTDPKVLEELLEQIRKHY